MSLETLGRRLRDARRVWIRTRVIHETTIVTHVAHSIAHYVTLSVDFAVRLVLIVIIGAVV